MALFMYCQEFLSLTVCILQQRVMLLWKKKEFSYCVRGKNELELCKSNIFFVQVDHITNKFCWWLMNCRPIFQLTSLSSSLEIVYATQKRQSRTLASIDCRCGSLLAKKTINAKFCFAERCRILMLQYDKWRKCYFILKENEWIVVEDESQSSGFHIHNGVFEFSRQEEQGWAWAKIFWPKANLGQPSPNWFGLGLGQDKTYSSGMG